ncbi:2-oxo-4-hydroxy-4-carboxy-5-ureidoimidazoline decarboxylase [Aliagarivorans taiwanensis]|uniref:2-oxo-4-hydroxy-4-carboxy-5-ureidoimidazoline decarboxylase n=1 Tax=Aliagarivorans taiwanensis TaxID=561966 RepID=UPI000416878F|nr:2-oxo-4-hydroxy-4-carboxy-5-ureidoimidazoline decarboxylase [Aliagarivorans taiwanensis]
MSPHTPLHEIGRHQLAQICASKQWQNLVLAQGPFNAFSEFTEAVDKAFDSLSEQDWLEAFAGHPMIGDISSLRAKYAHGKHLSEAEQSQVSVASEQTLQALLEQNQRYRERFGFIFIVFATGKSASEMLALLEARINNTRQQELANAAAEQRKISLLRMEAYR